MPSMCDTRFYPLFIPQTEYARFENGRFVYRISRSPMCEYMINFIHKLKHLPEKYMMNSVLENFTILLVIPAPSVFAVWACCCLQLTAKMWWVGGVWVVLEVTAPHSSHSTGDETRCENPRYLQGKGGEEPWLLTFHV